MHIVRFQQGGVAAVGLLEDGVVYEAQGDLYGDLSRGTAVGPLEGVKLLSPVRPSKLVAIGLNYLDHVTEDAPDFKPPENPIIFLKPPSSIIGPGVNIVYPDGPEHVDSEGELAVVIGRRARYVKAENVDDYILGFACSNDVSARDYQFKDGQWVRAKGFDTFSPIGPSIATGISATESLLLTCRLNGEVRQQSRTEMLMFGVPALIEFISRVMTLEPGDVVMTGTPAHPPQMAIGDVAEVEIEGVGILRNQVVAEERPS
ncbi:MAG TPA: fumarylacetoacetate hydrolase family protein [Nitrolancea sp.]|nr:fumarylacetoacetate hydrolase family protein [Nitrolancea sp.]